MKIIFGCILLSGVVQKIIVIKNDLNYNNICISNVIVAFVSIFIFLIMFIPIYLLIGENLPITLIIMLITYIISQILSIYIIKKEDMKKENFAILLVIVIYIIFGYRCLKNFKLKEIRFIALTITIYIKNIKLKLCGFKYL